MLKRIHSILRARGLKGLLSAVHRRLVRPQLASFPQCKAFFQDKIGLEIGGPSGVFEQHALLPVYPIAARIDNCNFGNATIWEGKIKAGATFHYSDQHAPGTQYIAEATKLSFAEPASYDFVLSSHTLEHVANPLSALAEWRRVLREDGGLALVLPHREATFDHRRPLTTLSHLIDDQMRNMDEGDLTHLDEILELHDFARDPESGGPATFKARALRNIENRCLHHHVFDTRLAVEMIDHMGFQILAAEAWNPFHIFVIAQKPPPGMPVRNASFLRTDATLTWRNPFVPDRENRRGAES